MMEWVKLIGLIFSIGMTAVVLGFLVTVGVNLANRYMGFQSRDISIKTDIPMTMSIGKKPENDDDV